LAIKELCKEQVREAETMTVVLRPGDCRKERQKTKVDSGIKVSMTDRCAQTRKEQEQ